MYFYKGFNVIRIYFPNRVEILNRRKHPEPEFLNFYGAQESIPRKQFRQHM